MRILTAGQKTALASPRVRMAYLVHLAFPSGAVRFTTNAHTMFYAGQEWLGAGGMLDIRLPQEDSSLEAHKAELTLDGCDPTVISLALNEPIENTPCIIYCALFDPDLNTPIGDFQYHRGTVSEVRIVPPTSSEQ